MKRLIILIVLLGVVYVLSNIVLTQVQEFINNASLIMSGIRGNDVREQIRKYFNDEVLIDTILAEDAVIELTPAHINTDSSIDTIARVVSEATCGSGGCMTVILLQGDMKNFEPIKFVYTVKEISIENTITNNMHDIRINNNGESIMKWNGEQYTLNAY